MKWRNLHFSKIIRDVTGGQKKIQKKAYLPQGQIPVVDQGQQLFSGYTNDETALFNKNIPVVIFGDHTRIVKYIDFPFALGADGVKVLETHGSLLPKFFYYYCQSIEIPSRGYSRHFKFLKNIKIPLPPPSEQHRIVEILDQADRLRKLRADADARAQHILPALFIKMFSDPVTNRKNWPIEKFGNVGTLERGKSKHRPRNDPVLLGGTHPLIQTGDVANSGGRIRSYTQTYSDVGLSQSRMWPSGTLCITIAANIAKTGIMEFDSCFPDSIVGFHPGPYVTTEYVQSWLWFLQPVLENSAPQAAQRNINLQVLRNLPIPIPPKKLQKKFSTQANDLNNQENSMEKVNSDIEKIFRSLLYRAFTGDLTASWREAHMKELLQEMELQAKALAS